VSRLRRRRGAQAVTWLAVSLVLFLVPYGMLVVELGSAFPALTISTTVLAYFFISPALVILRRKYPDAERPYRVPGGHTGPQAGMRGPWPCADTWR